jgi:hypothetical protein
MKRKTSHKKAVRHHRRRRVSGIGGGDMINTFAGALGGYVAGTMLSTKLFPTMDNKAKGAIIAAAGVLLVPKFLGQSPLMKGLGLGFGIAGGAVLLKEMKVISGRTDSVTYLPASVNGAGVSSMVNGTPKSGISSMINGRMNTREAAVYSM